MVYFILKLMIDYGEYSKDTGPKIFMVVLEFIVIFVSYMILFKGWGNAILSLIGIHVTAGDFTRRLLFLIFNLVLFTFYLPTLFVFVRRRVTWAEAVNVAVAFGVYYIGFPLLGYASSSPIGFQDFIAVVLFLTGIILHFVCEYQRHIFKNNPGNRGKLLTHGLWKFSRHFNYFSDLLWVSGYALSTHNWWSLTIIIALFLFFYFLNIPIQERHLESKYGEQFEAYKKQTKSLIPFLL